MIAKLKLKSRIVGSLLPILKKRKYISRYFHKYKHFLLDQRFAMQGRPQRSRKGYPLQDIISDTRHSISVKQPYKRQVCLQRISLTNLIH